MNSLESLAFKLSEYDELDLAMLHQVCEENSLVSCHVAILNQPYLDNIINGSKTIESRFSKVRSLPFKRIKKNDIVLFKEAAGCILALSSVKEVLFYDNMEFGSASKIIKNYQNELTATNDFMNLKSDSKYATLMFIGQTIVTKPIKLRKSDRRAWIVFEKDRNGKLL